MYTIKLNLFLILKANINNSKIYHSNRFKNDPQLNLKVQVFPSCYVLSMIVFKFIILEPFSLNLNMSESWVVTRRPAQSWPSINCPDLITLISQNYTALAPPAEHIKQGLVHNPLLSSSFIQDFMSFGLPGVILGHLGMSS